MRPSIDAALARARTRRRLPAPVARRMLRERAGLSQLDIGQALGVKREAVAQWEAGRRTPRGQLCEAYVQLLDRLASEPLRSA